MSDDVVCGIEAHVHDKDCYQSVLTCDKAESEHEHVLSCYSSQLICKKAEHTHTASCFALVQGNDVGSQSESAVGANAVPTAAIKVSSWSEIVQAVSKNNAIALVLQNDITSGSTVTLPVGKAVSLDLNGFSVNAFNTLFNVAGGSFTLTDSKTSSEEITVADGESYGNGAVLSKDSLTYYVTETEVVDQGIGATKETLKQHTVSLKGRILAKSSPVFTVSSGRLDIKSGALLNGTGRAIEISGGETSLSGGYIAGFSKSGSVQNTAGNNQYFGGAVRMSGGVLDLDGTVLAGNTALNGGAVYASGGTLNINGSILSGNSSTRTGSSWEESVYRNGGGAVYADGDASITMNSGYITNNNASSNASYFDGGGGVLISGNTSFVLNGGFITGNIANGGGGVRLDWKKDGLRMTVNGGYITANAARDTEGGGLAVTGGTAYIYGGFFTNNKVIKTPHWGGGALFCSDHGIIYMKNAVITKNRAGGFGGGIAGCPTGHIYLYATDGCADYENQDAVDSDSPHMSGSESAKQLDSELCNDFFKSHGHKDFFCALVSTVEGCILGNSPANWEGTADYEEVKTTALTDLITARRVMGLECHPTKEGVDKALEQAKVYITGNYSYTHGGGILCNGKLIIGEPEDIHVPSKIAFTAKKAFIRSDGKALPIADGDFEFTLTDSLNNLLATVSCDKDGNISFPYKELPSKDGTYVFFVSEKAGSNADIQYDNTVYRISVTVQNDGGNAIFGTTKLYRYNIVAVKVEKNSGDGNFELVSENQGLTLLSLAKPLSDGSAFTNKKADSTNITVVKKWVGTPTESVTVDLYRNGAKYDTAVLSAQTDWSKTWENLPLADGDKSYSYEVKERTIKGYVTTYATSSGDKFSSVVTVTNTAMEYARYRLNVTKLASDTNDGLRGAAFNLIGADGSALKFKLQNGVYVYDESGTVTDCVTANGGVLTLDNIPAGKYTLKEVISPVGYMLADDVAVTFPTGDDTTLSVTVTDEPIPTYQLPDTGGVGTALFTVFGSVILIGLAVTLIVVRKKWFD